MTRSCKRHIVGLTTAVIVFGSLSAIDNAHFYKAPNWHSTLPSSWFDGKRQGAAADWVTKLNVSFGVGDTSRCWDKEGHSANILNAAGPSNMLYALTNVPKLPSVTDPVTANALLLDHSMTNGDFGKIRFDGKFTMNEFDITWRQNLKKSWFVDLDIPIRYVKISDITKTDLSPTTGLYTKSNPIWKNVWNNFDTLLTNYSLDTYNKIYSKTGIGDISLGLGWHHFWDGKKDENNVVLKGIYKSLLFKGGLVLPTGKLDDANRLFSLPIGYNNHYGIYFYGQAEGGNDWLTLRGHGSVTVFLEGSAKDRRMKTSSSQTGYLKLATGSAKEQPGVLWHVGADALVEHVFSGFSAGVGYSFNRQEDNELTPSDTTRFPKSIVNEDYTLQAWYMHVAHFLLNFDCSEFMKSARWAPHFTGFYNLPFDGRNAYKTQIFGGSCGLTMRWDW